MLGIGSLFLMPFFLVYTVLSFVFRFAEAFKKNPSSMGSRTWTHYARQVFRDFNELPHAFESRYVSRLFRPLSPTDHLV